MTSRVSRSLLAGGVYYMYCNYIMFVRHDVIVVVHDVYMSIVAPVLPVWFGSVNRNVRFDSCIIS